MDSAVSAQPAKARVVPRTERLNHGPCGVDGPARAVLRRADAEHGHEPHRREVLDSRPEARHFADQPLEHPGKLEGRGALWRVELHSRTVTRRCSQRMPGTATEGSGAGEGAAAAGSASPGGSSAAASRRLSPCFAIR